MRRRPACSPTHAVSPDSPHRTPVLTYNRLDFVLIRPPHAMPSPSPSFLLLRLHFPAPPPDRLVPPSCTHEPARTATTLRSSADPPLEEENSHRLCPLSF